MKKFILPSLMLAVVGLVSCSSCAPKNLSTEVPVSVADASTIEASVDAGPQSVTVSGDDWSFVVPSKDWETQQSCAANGSCLTVATNDELQNIVILLRRPMTKTIDALLLEEVREAKEEGVSVDATKQLTLNGHNFASMEATKGNAKVFVWVTLSNGFGYEFSCGGPNDDGHQNGLCSGVVATLKIK